jgi:hypothetical protein
MEEIKKWMGAAPETCDICGTAIRDDFVDGRMRRGPWANMCLLCHALKGVGFGTGRGQHYHRHKKDWIKVD